jgi:hypothetical protein
MSRLKRYAELYTDIDTSDWDDQLSDRDAKRWRLNYCLKNNIPYEEETDNAMNKIILGE